MRCGSSAAPARGGEAVSYLELPARPAAAHTARCQVKVASQAWQLPADTTETASLLASELVANAIVHQASAAGQRDDASPLDPERIVLTLRHAPGQLVIEVFDASADPPVLTDVGPEAESGRGLMLVQALSKEWSYALVPSGGKVVYAILNA
jgi:anti-sigma regulatory factor (Ser/Thr protein kinase)